MQRELKREVKMLEADLIALEMTEHDPDAPGVARRAPDAAHSPAREDEGLKTSEKLYLDAQVHAAARAEEIRRVREQEEEQRRASKMGAKSEGLSRERIRKEFRGVLASHGGAGLLPPGVAPRRGRGRRSRLRRLRRGDHPLR